jgi:hypothetical protein
MNRLRCVTYRDIDDKMSTQFFNFLDFRKSEIKDIPQENQISSINQYDNWLSYKPQVLAPR